MVLIDDIHAQIRNELHKLDKEIYTYLAEREQEVLQAIYDVFTSFMAPQSMDFRGVDLANYKNKIEKTSIEQLNKGRSLLEKGESYADKAKGYLCQAACHGNKEAMYWMAMLESFQGNDAEAIRWCAYGAALGHAACQEMLAQAYERGDWGLEPSFAKAVLWYKEIIRYEHRGNCRYDIRCHLLKAWYERQEWPLHADEINAYFKDIDVFKYKRSYPNTCHELFLVLGDAYAAGDTGILPKNMHEACQQYINAAECGSAEGMIKASEYMLKGYGEIEDASELILNYLNRAAEKGYLEAEKMLGDVYFYGAAGIEKDKEKAVQHYQKVAELGGETEPLPENGKGKKGRKTGSITGFSYELGECYFLGEGVEQSYEMAISLFKKVVERREQNAALAKSYERLAECYEKGLGTETSDRLVNKYRMLAEATWENLKEAAKKASAAEAATVQETKTEIETDIKPKIVPVPQGQTKTEGKSAMPLQLDTSKGQQTDEADDSENTPNGCAGCLGGVVALVAVIMAMILMF